MAEKDRHQRMKEVAERLEQGVKEIFTSEMYMEYLKTMSQFHDYSFNNTLLIHMQKPDATLVAGYQAWQKKFHRQVRRGEKGIQIIAPAPIREKEEIEKIDPVTMEPVLKPDGTPETEEVVYTIPRFRITTVFDVSQTEGEPLPELETPELMGNVENYEVFMRAIQDVSPVPFRFDEIPSGAKGYYSSEDKEIVIQERMSERQTMKTSIHEVTHAKLHDRDIMEEMGEKKDKLTKEVEAESVAYIVCQYFGLDTSDYSFPYIAGWSSDKEMKELRASMDTIRKTASEFIDQMEERMQELKKEVQRHQEKALFEEENDRYGIYQIQDGGKGEAYRFMGMAYLQEKGMAVAGADYQFVYGDDLKEESTLESIYEKFNIDHPADYTGHSLSVSDVVVLKKGGELTAHYVDSFGYQELPDFVIQRMEMQEIQTAEKVYPPLYRPDLAYAVEHGDADAYLDSRKLNLECRQAIETAISGHFDGYHLAHDAAAEVVEMYGTERVSFVLACTIQHLKTDGRFSKETKEWADSFIIPENMGRGMDLNADYVVTSHPAVLDGFIGLARNEMREHGSKKVTGQISQETKGFSVDGHFGTWHTAEGKEIAGESFFRMEHDEYGNTVAGIIVNADGKLVAEDVEHGFDAGAMEAITEYLNEKIPEPFIKQFYVVNDAYGIKADREYQYFDNVDDALTAYHKLPNHLERQIGMESTETEPSRMTLIKCKNGIDELEDIAGSSISGKWVNEETKDALRKAKIYLENRDTEIAYEISGTHEYFYIQTTPGGYDYTFYNEKYRDIDGGIYENSDISIKEAAEDILEEEGLSLQNCHVVACEAFTEKVAQAEEIVLHGEKNTQEREVDETEILALAEEFRQFSYDFQFYEYQDYADVQEQDTQKLVEQIRNGETQDVEHWLKETIDESRDEEEVEAARALLEKLDRISGTVQKEPDVQEGKISFYVAECMEFPVLGEYHDNLTLEEAYRRYEMIPADRMNGGKGIGFQLEDGSLYAGEYELMRGGKISRDLIDMLPHYKESPLVQKAIADMEKILSHREEQLSSVRVGEKIEHPGSKSSSVKQSVLAALRERQARMKAEEQKQENRKPEQGIKGRRKGEPEL